MRNSKKLKCHVITWICILLMIPMVFFVPTEAMELEETGDPIHDSNVVLLQEKYSQLSSLKQTNIVSPIGKKANEYLNIYDMKLSTFSHDALYEESAKDLIELYYVQGVASNKVAWIYYTYIDSFSGSAKEAVDRVHGTYTADGVSGGLQEEIAKATKAKDLEQLSGLSYNNNGLCARMYVAVFEQKLLSLLQPEDSDAVKEIVTGEKGAIAAIKHCETVTSSEEYDEIYQKAAEAVLIRRNKDLAVTEIKEIFSVLYPDEDMTQNETVNGGINAINAETIKKTDEINVELEKTAQLLIDVLEKNAGKYADTYLKKLSSDVSAAVTVANEANRIADLSALLKDHSLLYARALAKDAIASDISAREYGTDKTMTDLEKEYNANDGVIDLCKDADAIAFETRRAKLRADMYGKYVESDRSIIGWVGEGELSESALDEYEFADYQIKKIDRTVERAYDDCVEEYEKGAKKLNKLVVEAEMQAYEPKHAEILNKEVSDITLEDKEALEAAINDMLNLSDAAQAAFEDKNTPDDLAAKYKAWTRLAIEEALGEKTDLRREQSDELSSRANMLTISGKADKLSNLVSDGKELVKRAQETDKVLERYEEILASDDYAGYSKENQENMAQIAKDAADSIADCEIAEGASVSDALGDLSRKEIAKLNRAEATARIDSKVAERSDLEADARAAVDLIVKKAKEELTAADDAARIKEIADRAVFDVAQEHDLQDADNRVDEIASRVDEMKFLSDEEKNGYKEALRKTLAEQAKLVRAASTADAHRVALNAMLQKLDEIDQVSTLAETSAKDAAKNAAKAGLQTAYDRISADLDAMSFLSDTEREALRQEAADALSKGANAIDIATEPSAIASAEKTATDSFEEITEKSLVANEEAGKDAKNDVDITVRTSAAQVFENIDNKPYLSQQDKTDLKAAVDAVMAEFAKDLKAARGNDELLLAQSKALESLTEVKADCEGRNLDGAKVAAKDALRSEKEKLDKDISGFIFLDEAKKDAFLNNGDAFLMAAGEKIDGCETVDRVLSEKDTAMKELADFEKTAKKAENDACVTALTPFIVGLAIAFAVELVALAALWLINRGRARRMAAYVPIPALMLALSMPAPLAWSLTILLVFADLLLAGLIVYQIVLLIKGGRREEPEDELEEAPVPEPEEWIESEGFEAEKTDGEISSVPVHVNAGMPVSTEKRSKPSNRLGAGRRLARLFAPPARLKIEPKPQLVYLMPPTMPTLLGSVTVEEADLMISDEDAFHYEETNIVNNEIYTGKKKASVNIDTIGACFSAEDVVTLNSLKEKKLISEKVGYVKILGRGRLDKPLTVIAQNFSASAVKMIVLTGGSAVLAEGSHERKR